MTEHAMIALTIAVIRRNRLMVSQSDIVLKQASSG
jgi:hypothetical protein